MAQASYQPEERARRHRQLTEQSIKFALASRWEDAVSTNRELLESFPRDLSALNRLGKALSEMGRYAEAKRTYNEALEVEPGNSIARKNLDRLANLSDEGPGHRAAERIDPRLFIEETGKTGFTNLVDLAPRSALAKLSAGEQVHLRRDNSLLYVENAAGERIGRIEPRLASRLVKFIEGGNQYAAGIADLAKGEVRLIVRETFQQPSQFGKVSFPSRGGGEPVRGYIKDSMLRRDLDDDDEFNEDGEYVDSDDEEAEEGRTREGEHDLDEGDFIKEEE